MLKVLKVLNLSEKKWKQAAKCGFFRVFSISELYAYLCATNNAKVFYGNKEIQSSSERLRRRI